MMKAYIVGYHKTKSEWTVYHVTFEQKNSGLIGENVASVLSKHEHELGEEINIRCSKSKGVFTYFEAV